ncbi:hypothetical protein Bbelb_094800 [Branchiostoma belcheri]|nr:hypothetical protein Bbelb_094800 [Branchiostoma belcheri]
MSAGNMAPPRFPSPTRPLPSVTAHYPAWGQVAGKSRNRSNREIHMPVDSTYSSHLWPLRRPWLIVTSYSVDLCPPLPLPTPPGDRFVTQRAFSNTSRDLAASFTADETGRSRRLTAVMND